MVILWLLSFSTFIDNLFVGEFVALLSEGRAEMGEKCGFGEKIGNGDVGKSSVNRKISVLDKYFPKVSVCLR